MNALFAFQVTIWKNGAVQEVKEVSVLYLILPAIGILISIVFVICLLLLVKKEIDISKGKRSDLSSADRTKAACFMGLSLFSSLLMLFPFAKLGSFAGLEPLKIIGYALILLLRYSGADLLFGATVLVLHHQNVKKLAQPDASEQREIQRRQSDALLKNLRAALLVLFAAAIAISGVWLIWFRDQRQILLIAYAVYLVVGWIWLTWIIVRNKKKETPKQEQNKTHGTEEFGSAPHDGRGI